ncbi:MAG: YkgJ family cysteine cluster protein [Pirellulaceae bacterium]|nr:YkgJ family cysteine cluster protein [Pirellulaceae bacterium]
MLPILENRTCGDCQACCTELPIPANIVSREEKKEGCACPHLQDFGCKIYSRRPATCQKFQCTWLAEETWKDSWKPNKSGLLCLREILPNNLIGALVYEIHEGALESSLGQKITARLLTVSDFVILKDKSGKRQTLRKDHPEKSRPYLAKTGTHWLQNQ